MDRAPQPLTGLVASAASWEDLIAKSVSEDVRATAEKVAHAVKLTEFDRWVGDNNIPSSYEYGAVLNRERAGVATAGDELRE